jgi:hypothetical protein
MHDLHITESMRILLLAAMQHSQTTITKGSMTLSEVILYIDEQNNEAIIFAKKINGTFFPTSEVVLVELEKEEQGLPTNEITKTYCPGYDYFLEVFLVKDMVEDVNNSVGYKPLNQQIDRIIHDAEFDA